MDVMTGNPPNWHAGQPHDRDDAPRPTISQQMSDSSTSDDDYATPLTSSYGLQAAQQTQAESAVVVSISRAQSRLASATTPAIEKEAAIQQGGGYFSLDGVLDEAANETSLSEVGSEPSNDGRPSEHRLNDASRATIKIDLPEELSFPQQIPKRSTSISTTASGAAEFHYQQVQSQKQTVDRQRANSIDELSLRRALSTASSLGDDSRFENVKEQVNNRFKAIKDSFQDTTFRMPQLPKFPNILNAVSKSSLNDEESRGSGSPRKVGFELMDSIRKRTSTYTKPLALKDEHLAVPSAQLNTTFAASHPHFTQALQDLTGDLMVMGGYRGSILRSREVPNQRAWIPLKAGFGLAKVNLEVGLTDEDEERMPDTIYPDGMLTHIGPVDISRRLFKKLRAAANVQTGDLRVHNYGYDWRLSPHRLSQELLSFVEQLPCNSKQTPASERGVWILAHSLGGLIIRHAVNQRPELFRGVVYVGTPNTCVNILGPLRNGDDVLFNSKILTAQVNFTIRTSFALLPLDGKCFVDEETKEELHVDFFDVRDWIRHELSPCVARPRRRSSTSKNASLPQFMTKSIGDALDNIQSFGRRSSIKKIMTPADILDGSSNNTASNQMSEETGMAPQMSSHNHESHNKSNSRPRASSTSIPYSVAVEYLERTLTAVKKFKQELAPLECHTKSNAYPPAAVIYGKSEPTVSTARVNGYKGISGPDAYDNLGFASGDGVVLARAAMLPDGYKAVKGGVIGSDRGHITLLGDLEAVGRALIAVMRARSHGVGIGPPSDEADGELDNEQTKTRANV
jgi:pimeloyl-ACP methyl ester carboxylesterase